MRYPLPELATLTAVITIVGTLGLLAALTATDTIDRILLAAITAGTLFLAVRMFRRALDDYRELRWFHRLHRRSTLGLDAADWGDYPLNITIPDLRTIAYALGPDATADDTLGWLYTYQQTNPMTRVSLGGMNGVIRAWPARNGHPGWLLLLAGITPTEPLPADTTRETLTVLATLRGQHVPGT